MRCFANYYGNPAVQEISIAADVKQPAGQWGMVGDCDAPYWLLTNMLDFIQKNHKDVSIQWFLVSLDIREFFFQLDYVMVSGDLTSHADWDYSRESHVAMVKNISDTIRS